VKEESQLTEAISMKKISNEECRNEMKPIYEAEMKRRGRNHSRK